MFCDLLTSLLHYNVTNTQVFTNNTSHDATIQIHTNASNDNTYDCVILSSEQAIVPVLRNEFGLINALVTVKYSNGICVAYTFYVVGYNCIDYCELYDKYVVYNGKKRGTVIKSNNEIDYNNDDVNEQYDDNVNEQYDNDDDVNEQYDDDDDANEQYDDDVSEQYDDDDVSEQYDDDDDDDMDDDVGGDGDTNNKQMYIYVLRLEDDKYYIGKTINPLTRIEDHMKARGSVWTKKYKPVEIIEILKQQDDYDEDKITFKYMKDKGIDNVRGGSFCQITLNEANIETIKLMIFGASDKCFNCGSDDHFVSKCNKKKRMPGQTNLLSKMPVSKKISYMKNTNKPGKLKLTNKENCICYRCERKGHYASECLAKKNNKKRMR